MNHRDFLSALAAAVLTVCTILYAAGAGALSFVKIIDTDTAIPDGTGNFTFFVEPSFGAGNIAFWGQGSGDQSGIYRVIGGTLSTVADNNTAVPGGTGNFSSFTFGSGFIDENGTVVFSGSDSDSGSGVYKRAVGGALEVVADESTAVPGGSGNFIGFGLRTSISGGNVAFTGINSNFELGIYLSSGGGLSVVADTGTIAPPSVEANFESANTPNINGSNVAFEGFVENLPGILGPDGVYKHIGATLSVVADTNMLIPGTAAEFDAVEWPNISGANVAFLGFENMLLNPTGVYSDATGVLAAVVDQNTVVPDAGGATFASFSFPSYDGGKIVFTGSGSGGILGIYVANLGGNLDKLIDKNDALDPAKPLSGLSTRWDALSGNEIAFQANFTDSSSAIYVASLVGNNDNDGIAAAIDGSWDGNVFTDLSGVFSDSWTDQHFGGGTTFGTILDRSDLTVTVSDEPNPAGVRVEFGGSGGVATANLCGFQLLFTAGNVSHSTCSSLNLDVISGPITAVLAADTFVIVPSSVATALSDLGDGEFLVEHLSGSEPIVVDIDGVPTDLNPGDPPLTVSTADPDSDGDGVADDQDNCTQVANPMQIDSDSDGIGNLCDQDIAPLPNDCDVNPTDLGALRAAFFATPGAGNWNPDADFNSDGVVNPVDLGLMRAAFFGTPGPSGLPNACD